MENLIDMNAIENNTDWFLGELKKLEEEYGKIAMKKLPWHIRLRIWFFSLKFSRNLKKNIKKSVR